MGKYSFGFMIRAGSSGWR